MAKLFDLIRLARPKQWAKSAFVLIGPLYGLAEASANSSEIIKAGLITAVAFAIASSACYVVNDLMDAELDRAHPRKRRRPIASGAVSKPVASAYAAILTVVSLGMVAALPEAGPGSMVRVGVGALLCLYIANVWGYSLWLKHVAIADVLSLSLGFVIRLIAGCAATAISPSTWLLNVTLFLAMFLSFGKRLGERRSLGDAAEAARGVHSIYTNELLRMAVVVTAVGTLLAYASYVQAQDLKHTHLIPWLGFKMNVLWLTTIPATYGLLRSILLLERGEYDDPTELATRDRWMIACVLVFAGLTGWVLWWK